MSVLRPAIRSSFAPRMRFSYSKPLGPNRLQVSSDTGLICKGCEHGVVFSERRRRRDLGPLQKSVSRTRLSRIVAFLREGLSANLATDLEASRERLATCCQPHGNREGPTCLSCKYRRKRKPPIILASSGCLFTQLSYSLRTACLALSFDIRPSTLFARD